MEMPISVMVIIVLVVLVFIALILIVMPGRAAGIGIIGDFSIRACCDKYNVQCCAEYYCDTYDEKGECTKHDNLKCIDYHSSCNLVNIHCSDKQTLSDIAGDKYTKEEIDNICGYS